MALEDAGSLGRNRKGAAIFCAVGNDYGKPVGFPASDENAIAVGASTDLGELANYSNIGPEVDLVAPSSGGRMNIFTTDVSFQHRGFNNQGGPDAGGEDGLFTNGFGGTSAATPLAAGIGALMLSVNPELSRDQLRQILLDTAAKIGDSSDYKNGHSEKYGYGRVNAAKAVAKAKSLASEGPSAGVTWFSRNLKVLFCKAFGF